MNILAKKNRSMDSFEAIKYFSCNVISIKVEYWYEHERSNTTLPLLQLNNVVLKRIFNLEHLGLELSPANRGPSNG